MFLRLSLVIPQGRLKKHLEVIIDPNDPQKHIKEKISQFLITKKKKKFVKFCQTMLFVTLFDIS